MLLCLFTVQRQYELVLSNGCPNDCDCCYLELTSRGKKGPVLFSNERAWVQMWETICKHFGEYRSEWDSTVCPHKPWCMGSWQRVRWDNGVLAECECECGGLWIRENPLYVH